MNSSVKFFDPSVSFFPLLAEFFWIAASLVPPDDLSLPPPLSSLPQAANAVRETKTRAASRFLLMLPEPLSFGIRRVSGAAGHPPPTCPREGSQAAGRGPAGRPLPRQ